MVDSSVVHAYDAVASKYDAQLARNPVAAEMRRQLHVHFGHIFRSGDRVLDFTAGTGADALYLASRGISVTALDASLGMIAELRQNAAHQNSQIESSVLSAERIGELDGHFDGAISAFAGLNTIEDMPLLARNLAALIKPRGHVVLHALNRFCFWQWSANLLRQRGARDGAMCVGAVSVPHRLFDPLGLWREVFAPYFDVCQLYALSVIAAPAVVKRIPRVAPLIFRLDRTVGRMFPAAGDFFVMDLVRSDERGHTGP